MNLPTIAAPAAPTFDLGAEIERATEALLALEGARIADDRYCQCCGARGTRWRFCPTCERT
jgi:hypothetical protein